VPNSSYFFYFLITISKVNVQTLLQSCLTHFETGCHLVSHFRHFLYFLTYGTQYQISMVDHPHHILDPTIHYIKGSINKQFSIDSILCLFYTSRAKRQGKFRIYIMVDFFRIGIVGKRGDITCPSLTLFSAHTSGARGAEIWQE